MLTAASTAESPRGQETAEFYDFNFQEFRQFSRRFQGFEQDFVKGFGPVEQMQELEKQENDSKPDFLDIQFSNLLKDFNQVQTEDLLPVLDLAHLYQNAFDLMDIQANVLEKIIQDMGYRLVAGKHDLYESVGISAEDAVRDHDHDQDYDDRDLDGQDDDDAQSSFKDSFGPSLSLSGLSLHLLSSTSSDSAKPIKKSHLAALEDVRDSIDSIPPPPLLQSSVAELESESTQQSTTLASVSDSAYASLSPIVTTQITTAYLNDCVAEINDLLTDKRFIMDEGVDSFTLAELQEASKLSQVRLQAVLVALVELKRVVADGDSYKIFK